MPVDAVRRFNRFYTRRIGVLREGLLGGRHPLPEARVIYELGARGACTAAALGRDLGLDAGYLSRLLRGLRRRGLVGARAAREDARARVLALSARGRKAYAALDARARAEVTAMLAPLAASERARLVAAMQAVQELLGEGRAKTDGIALRTHRPGDMGWVVSRHGALYAEEYGWDERFEALVAGIVKEFVERLDAARERCWIAELDGVPVGSVFCVRKSDTTAQLRLLIVEPRARGRGLGRRLVEECIAFARASGYRRLVLWTQSNLDAARHIYRAAGFARVKQERHREFGIPLTGEYWRRAL